MRDASRVAKRSRFHAAGPNQQAMMRDDGRRSGGQQLLGIASGLRNLHNAARARRDVLQSTATAIAEGNSNAQNDAIAATIEQGQVNMARLEQSVIKDNTLMPSERYGGQLHRRSTRHPAIRKAIRLSLRSVRISTLSMSRRRRSAPSKSSSKLCKSVGKQCNNDA